MGRVVVQVKNRKQEYVPYDVPDKRSRHGKEGLSRGPRRNEHRDQQEYSDEKYMFSDH